MLDGGLLRQGLCAGLGFSQVDRSENTRRVAALLHAVDVIAIVLHTSPFRSDRAKEIVGKENYLMFI